MKSLNILLVENHPGILNYIKSLFEIQGWQVQPEINAVAALDFLRHIKSEEYFDVIVSDYKMPGKTGIQFAQEVRKREKAENLPKTLFILMSSEMLEDFIWQDSGIDMFFDKMKINIIPEYIKEKLSLA